VIASKTTRTADLNRVSEEMKAEIKERLKAEEEANRVKIALQNVFDGISEPLLMIDFRCHSTQETLGSGFDHHPARVFP
jgi:hypothetical protein